MSSRQPGRIPIDACQVSLYVARRTPQGPRWLLLRRSADAKPYPGVWQQVTGGLEPNEQAHQAALRELREETGLEARELYSADSLEMFFESSTQSIWLTPVFLAIVDSDQVSLCCEHDSFEWLCGAQAQQKVPFRQQRQTLAMLEEEFFESQPNEHLRIL
jgi:8-oxo-dGTP pyrophosphatase MutT (NUDIX family)